MSPASNEFRVPDSKARVTSCIDERWLRGCGAAIETGPEAIDERSSYSIPVEAGRSQLLKQQSRCDGHFRKPACSLVLYQRLYVQMTVWRIDVVPESCKKIWIVVISVLTNRNWTLWSSLVKKMAYRRAVRGGLIHEAALPPTFARRKLVFWNRLGF
jgi:hypothetical protein